MLPIFFIIQNENDRLLAEMLYRKYKHQMYGIAYSILHNRADAEDVVMDSVYKIVKNIDKFSMENGDRNESLIIIITRNTAINRYRANKRRSHISLDDLYETQHDISEDPQEIFLTAQSAEELIQKIRVLEPIYRDVLLMKYLYDYNDHEIADMVGISQTTVRVRLMRAKKKLSDALKGGGI